MTLVQMQYDQEPIQLYKSWSTTAYTKCSHPVPSKTENLLQLHPSESSIREPEVFVSILTWQSCITNPSNSHNKEPGNSYKHPKDQLATIFLENDSEESAV